MRGYQSSKNEPIFDGKKVTDYDAIIQGHVHFDMEDYLEQLNILDNSSIDMLILSISSNIK